MAHAARMRLSENTYMALSVASVQAIHAHVNGVSKRELQTTVDASIGPEDDPSVFRRDICKLLTAWQHTDAVLLRWKGRYAAWQPRFSITSQRACDCVPGVSYHYVELTVDAAYAAAHADAVKSVAVVAQATLNDLHAAVSAIELTLQRHARGGYAEAVLTRPEARDTTGAGKRRRSDSEEEEPSYHSESDEELHPITLDQLVDKQTAVGHLVKGATGPARVNARAKGHPARVIAFSRDGAMFTITPTASLNEAGRIVYAAAGSSRYRDGEALAVRIRGILITRDCADDKVYLHPVDDDGDAVVRYMVMFASRAAPVDASHAARMWEEYAGRQKNETGRVDEPQSNARPTRVIAFCRDGLVFTVTPTASLKEAGRS